MSMDATLLVAIGIAGLSAVLKFARDLYALRAVRKLSADCDTNQRATISMQLVNTLRAAPGREAASELLKKRVPATEIQS